MLLRYLLIASLLMVSAAFAAELSEKIQKKLDAADAAYQQAVAKAENARFYAVQKANADRMKVLKAMLGEATKAGDFDTATAIKQRITDNEIAEVTDPAEVKKGRVFFLTALYGVNQSWSDVTDRMNKLALENKPIRLTVSDSVFPDPAPAFEGGNSFVARYIFNGKIFVVSEFTGKELVIPPR